MQSQAREPGTPQASQINHARRPAPKPARSTESGPPDHEPGQGPKASQVMSAPPSRPEGADLDQPSSFECMMKPAPSAAPQGGCVDSQLDPAVAILRNAGRLREQPTFTQSLELRFATSCYWFELRSGTARPPDAVDHIMIEFPAQNALAQDSYRRQYSSCARCHGHLQRASSHLALQA